MKKLLLIISILLGSLVVNAQTKVEYNNFHKYMGAALVAHAGTAYFQAEISKDKPLNTYYRNSCIFLSSVLLVCALKEIKINRIEPAKSGFGIAYKF